MAAKGFARGVDIDEFTHTLLTKDSYSIAVRPEDFEEFEYICDGAAARPDVTLAIDEIDLWLPNPNMVPPRGVMNMSLTGGHHNQTLICVTHRPVAIHKSVFTQAVVWVFPMFDATDRKTVIDHTRRLSHPEGVDPGKLEILDTNERGWIKRVEVARVDVSDVKLCTFDIDSGVLSI